jgi:MarR family 2-MHQ and catechol resistance regulon transcriptional repressor
MRHALTEFDEAAGQGAAQPTPCRNAAAQLSAAELSLAGLLLRTADCLTALVHSPTAQAGLNESRYNVLDALRRKGIGLCSQTELATHLLQSESNLSTLLERMRQDGLITRVRSESDRRVTLIALSASGREAVARADQARARAAAPILGILGECGERALCDALGRLVKKLERTLGIANRPPAGAIRSGPNGRGTGNPSQVCAETVGGRTPAGIRSTATEGATP